MGKIALIIFTSALAINYSLAAQTLKDVPPDNYIRDFVSKNADTNNKNQQELNALLQKKGFLKGSQYAVDAQNTITKSKDALNKLTDVQDQLDVVDQNLANFGPYYQLLDNATPENKPPFNCYNVQNGIKGVVDKKPGSTGFAFMVNENGKAKYYDFIDPITDVGFMKSGAEYVVSYTPQGKAQMAHVNESGVVDCLSNPINP